MDPIFFFYLSSSEDESDGDVKVIRRLLRDKSNPFELPHKAFLKRFRLTKEAFEYVLQKLDLKQKDARGVPPVLQLAATLSLLASGGLQQNVGEDYLVGMGQSTVSKLTAKVLTEIQIKLCPQFIRFEPKDTLSCKEWFMEHYKIPGVVGCLDGTHIALQKPTADEHLYLNRKGYYSINAMIISDHTHKILAINCQYGGTALDSYVWKHSTERRALEERFQPDGQEDAWLLADSAYPLEPWCITPYRDPAADSSEAMFNEIHSKARHTIERSIAILKGRWRIMRCGKRRGRYHPSKMAKFANVCAALHNICIKFKIPYDPKNNDSDAISEMDDSEANDLTAVGQRIRDKIKGHIFNL